MTQGKQICRLLKDIRSRIAEENGIELVTSECDYEGECSGSCPKCDEELRYLNELLASKEIKTRVEAGGIVKDTDIRFNDMILGGLIAPEDE